MNVSRIDKERTPMHFPEINLSDAERRPTTPSLTDAPRVLVVEDDPELRELIAKVFAFEGYFVTEVADGPAMLRAVGAAEQSFDDAFDLIVTDVRMPGISGLDALARLRKVGCRTPTIVVTAFPEEVVQRLVRELDALLLPKPFAMENLRVIANRAVAARQGG